MQFGKCVEHAWSLLGFEPPGCHGDGSEVIGVRTLNWNNFDTDWVRFRRGTTCAALRAISCLNPVLLTRVKLHEIKSEWLCVEWPKVKFSPNPNVCDVCVVVYTVNVLPTRRSVITYDRTRVTTIRREGRVVASIRLLDSYHWTVHRNSSAQHESVSVVTVNATIWTNKPAKL